MTIDYRHWAEYLLDGVTRRVEVQSISTQVESFSVDDAYLVQEQLLQLKLAAGETLVGAKLGLTSVAKQQQMGVNEPCYGWITSGSVLTTNEVPLGELIHPRIEPEFVFTMAEAIGGADVTAADVLDATESVRGGIEVIDSRYEAFKFTLPDVIADNTSAARARIGVNGMAPRSTDAAKVACSFSINGEVTGSATGADLLGDPAGCVAMLVRHLHKTGRRLEAGWTILAGAPTDARPLALGTIGEAIYSAFAPVTVTGV